MPELPQNKRKRYSENLGISPNDIKVLINDRLLDRFFQACCQEAGPDLNANTISKWIVGELSAQLKDFSKELLFKQLKAIDFVNILTALNSGKIASNQAKNILNQVLQKGESAAVLIEKESAEVISDDSILEKIVEEIFQEDPSAKDKFYGDDAKAKAKVANFVMGQIMKKTKGKVKPDAVKTFLASLSWGRVS